MNTQDQTHTLAIRQILKNSGTDAAERHLMTIGDAYGDEQLTLIVGNLLPGEVASFIGEGDYTKPSLVAGFVTAEQFLDALERLGSGWGSLKGNVDPSIICDMRQHVTDFVLSVMLTADEVRREELAEQVLSNDLGKDVLVLSALGQAGCPEFLREDHLDAAMAEKGTWQELYVEIQDLPGFQSVKRNILSLYPPNEEGKDEEDTNPLTGKPRADHPSWKFTKSVIRSLASRALAHAGQEDKTELKAPEVFVFG